MKIITFIDIAQINQILESKNINYTLKLQDTCGNQALTLIQNGEKKEIAEICEIINVYLKPKYMQVKPGKIKSENLMLY